MSEPCSSSPLSCSSSSSPNSASTGAADATAAAPTSVSKRFATGTASVEVFRLRLNIAAEHKIVCAAGAKLESDM
jgi:hypothetical protein